MRRVRRLADALVNRLLRWTRWYHPEAIAAQERRSEAAITESRNARMEAERTVGRTLGSYRRIRM